MNDQEFEATIRDLPLSATDQNTALSLARRPSRRALFIAVIFTILSVLALILGWDGAAFTFHKPAVESPPFPALHAYGLARMVQMFYLGIIFLLISITNFISYWNQVRQHRLMKTLVSLIPQHGRS